jgi:hypothetical protein
MPAQGSIGKVRIFTDFLGEEIPVANAVAYGSTAGGCSYYLGGFKVIGDLVETDTGVVAIAKAGGYARISGNDENGKGVAVATETVFSPVLSAPMILETRLERQVLTAGVVFAGFCGLAADDVAEPLTSATVTHTMVATDLCGFLLDSQLTAAAVWHCVYNGGSTTGATSSLVTTSGVTAVAGESDILRLVIDPNGTARYFINGALVKTVTGAVSTTVLQAAMVGCFGTTSTAADVDVDYILVEGNRDWTR